MLPCVRACKGGKVWRRMRGGLEKRFTSSTNACNKQTNAFLRVEVQRRRLLRPDGIRGRAQHAQKLAERQLPVLVIIEPGH